MPSFINMSNIGKQIIIIDAGVQVTLEDNTKVVVKGPKGELSMDLPRGIGIDIQEGSMKVKKLNDSPQYSKFYGLARARLANIVKVVRKKKIDDS